MRFIRDYTEQALERPGPGEPELVWYDRADRVRKCLTHSLVRPSTFTGYITRLGGYYRDGRYSRTYYFMPQHMYVLHRQKELKGPFWSREFAVATEDIDDTVDVGVTE